MNKTFNSSSCFEGIKKQYRTRMKSLHKIQPAEKNEEDLEKSNDLGGKIKEKIQATVRSTKKINPRLLIL